MNESDEEAALPGKILYALPAKQSLPFEEVRPSDDKQIHYSNTEARPDLDEPPVLASALETTFLSNFCLARAPIQKLARHS